MLADPPAKALPAAIAMYAPSRDQESPATAFDFALGRERQRRAARSAVAHGVGPELELAGVVPQGQQACRWARTRQTVT